MKGKTNSTTLARSNSDNKSRSSGQSVSSWPSKFSDEYFADREKLKDIDKDFRSLVIYVFKNGDEYEKPLEMTINRRLYKHWISFLEALTKKLKADRPVNFIYTMEGQVIPNFRGLKDGDMYVAAWRDFKPVKYGSKVDKKFKVDPKLPLKKDPLSLESAESVEMYMRKMGYKSKTGLPYPEDMNEARIARINGKSSIENFFEAMKTPKSSGQSVRNGTKSISSLQQAKPVDPVHQQKSLDRPIHPDTPPMHRTSSLPDISGKIHPNDLADYNNHHPHHNEGRKDTFVLPPMDSRDRPPIDHRYPQDGRWSPGRSYPGESRHDPYYNHRDPRDFDRWRDPHEPERYSRDREIVDNRNFRRPYSQERRNDHYNDRRPYEEIGPIVQDRYYKDDRYDDRRPLDYNGTWGRDGPPPRLPQDRYELDRGVGDFDRRGLHVDERARLTAMGRSYDDISSRKQPRDVDLNVRSSQIPKPTVSVNPPSAKGGENHKELHR